MVRLYRLQRVADLDGRTLCFMAFLGSRDRGWKTFRVEDVPPFDGPTATFEIDRRRGAWVFVRRVD